MKRSHCNIKECKVKVEGEEREEGKKRRGKRMHVNS